MQSCLLLNASYEPLSVVSARRAITLIENRRAVPLDESPAVYRSATRSVAVPYVALLTTNVRRPQAARAIRYTRRGVFYRDSFKCVYCGKRGETIDHVIPRALGGHDSYENCVTACYVCNGKKGKRTLADLGWSLPAAPRPVSQYELLLHQAKPTSGEANAWQKYIAYYAAAV